MKTTLKRTVKSLAYHRNGISGLGFHVAIIREHEDGDDREMLVIRFPKVADKETGAVVCAAFDLARLDKRDVDFCSNSWRGDRYHEWIDEVIAKRDNQL